MSETALATLRVVQHIYCHQLGLLVTGNDHLGYALPVVHDKRLIAQVYQDDSNLTTIVGINGARRIHQRNTMLQSQSAARTYLCLVAYGKGYAQTSRNQTALKGL